MNDLSPGAIRHSFDRAARHYDESAVLQRAVADELLNRFQWLRIKPATLLDVGTGTGYALPHLRRRFRNTRVLACDIAWAMARAARSRRVLWRPSPVWVADAHDLPLRAQTIDCIYSSLALQWMDAPRAFAEFRRVLRGEGLLTFATFGPDTLRELRAAWAQVDDRPHVHNFVDMHDLGDALINAGFADPVLDIERYTLTYESAGAALRDLKHIGAHNAAAARFPGLTGKGRYRRFEQAYEKFRQGGRLPVTYEVVYGQAWVLAGVPPPSLSSTDRLVIPIRSA
jgi:malonyl-CoA O-methyltransferase